MKGEDVYLVEPLCDWPAVRKPFQGGYERVTNVRTQDCFTALYVFEILPNGKRAYVGTFEAPYAHQCYSRFLDWLWIQKDRDVRLGY